MTEIRIRKTESKLYNVNHMLAGLLGILVFREIVPMERARPNIRSERDSMRGRGCLTVSATMDNQYGKWLVD
jgi:hypothetical protein